MDRPVLPARRVSLSIVVPLYDEREVFPELARRVGAAAGEGECEVLLVDDGSTDGTGALVRELCGRDGRFVGVHFSRNFGHQMAVSAGLDLARGDAVAVIDGDLQDPPEMIAPMLARLREGFDVVYAVRRDRKEGPFLRLAYAAFYRLLRALSPMPIPLDSGDCCVMSRRVVDVIRASPERHRFVRGLRSYAGFRQTGHEYAREARAGGTPKYTFRRLLGLAADGVFTFSERPLRIATAAGVLAAVGSLGCGGWLLASRLLYGREIPGSAALAVGMFFLAGVQLLCIGILGEYVGRIHNEVKGRPNYVVESISLGKGTGGAPEVRGGVPG